MKDQPKKKNRTPRSALQKMVLILLITALVLGLIGAALLLILNAVVTAPGKERILPLEEGSALTDADCILVLGCQVKDHNLLLLHGMGCQVLPSYRLLQLN